jgi:hypothetical protein
MSGNCSMEFIRRRRRLQDINQAMLLSPSTTQACSRSHLCRPPQRRYMAAPPDLESGPSGSPMDAPHFNFSFISFWDPSAYLPNLAGWAWASNPHEFCTCSWFDWIMPVAQAPQFLWIYWTVGLLGEAMRNQSCVHCTANGRCTTLVRKL